ncbi:transcriptional regulator [Chloroflexus sp.]|uniref:winged helix-turn-helix domain-containing protein n=1 Tax=Chloroflexus sp. TaxID=1904827 RepID=UPI00298EDDDD|nr:transcriptional regulator [Chloroflexus sp.]MCX7860919.1 transcriptional regulator [Chloroflexus sp.]MDW8406037.1 transcriptional regulator [Chloroflexus sp.]
MKLQMHQLASLDRLIHEPARLMIVALLYTVESADFLFLQRETGLSKGNLSVHLSKLEQAGYVQIEKTYRGKLPLTLCTLTEAGREAFQHYRRSLHHLVAATDDSNTPPAIVPTPAG